MRHIKFNLSVVITLFTLLTLLTASACEGPAGPVGASGLDGADGKDGQDGADGSPGNPGVNGAPGEPGAPGENGAPGEPGLDGADGICAGREMLEITGIEGVPSNLYERQLLTLTVLSNVADPASLRLSVPTGGSGRATFADLGDGSLSLITGAAVSGVERFTLFATDGCTIATYTLELNALLPTPSSTINVVNLTEIDLDVWSALNVEGIGEVESLEISYLGLDAQSVEGERTIKSGANVIRVFAEGEVDDPADGFEPESLLGELSVVVDAERYYILTLERGEAGITGTLIDMGGAPPLGTGVVGVSHQAMSIGPVSIFTVNESVEPPMTTEVISDLEYGQSSEPLTMPQSVYQFGVDLDTDGEMDVSLPQINVLDGTRSLIVADLLETACYVGPAFTIIKASASSFSSDVSVWAQVPPPSDQDVTVINGQVDGAALSNALPYAVSYGPQERVNVGDSSYRQINAPVGTAQIRLGVSFETEVFWDELVVYDRDREEIYRDDGENLCVEIIVPGDVAILGVNSDGGTERSGYVIRALSFE